MSHAIGTVTVNGVCSPLPCAASGAVLGTGKLRLSHPPRARRVPAPPFSASRRRGELQLPAAPAPRASRRAKMAAPGQRVLAAEAPAGYTGEGASGSGEGAEAAGPGPRRGL